MSEVKRRPSAWYYVLALIIPVFACVGTALFVYPTIPDLPGSLGALDTKNLTKVIIPGSMEVSFPKKGAYAVYYESRSDINGVRYSMDEYPPSMMCQLKSKVTGEAVKLEPSNIKGNVYTTGYPERAGVLYKQISIDHPGVYTFSCQYRDGGALPKFVMAVGPNIVWEFLNIALKPVASFLFGVLAFVFACVISILIIGFVAYKRYQSRGI